MRGILNFLLTVALCGGINDCYSQSGQIVDSIRLARQYADSLKFVKAGLEMSVWDWHYVYDYSKSIRVQANVVNHSKSPVKYVWFHVIAKDAVGGRLRSLGKSVEVLKAIGPILKGEVGTYSFEHAFWSEVIEQVCIQKIVVEYMNGVKKEFLKLSAIASNEESQCEVASESLQKYLDR